MATRSWNPYYGIYYRSNGKWTGPYAGRKYTWIGLNREPLKSNLRWLKNRCLKSRVKIRRVAA